MKLHFCNHDIIVEVNCFGCSGSSERFCYHTELSIYFKETKINVESCSVSAALRFFCASDAFSFFSIF